ncbi:DUF4263 domain-containing protein [Edaphobacter paludis]|uniref:DUF4263 domain-containing protein n=1 Tax=Edaphobacter paludis TaxID=3035702 RepID=A0AAU7DBS8_9BACT
MERIETQSTSRNTATTSDIVLREGPQTRLLFRPEIVNNASRPEAAVRGRFLYQRKKRNGEWIEFDRLPLTSVKVDEGYQLEISSSELHTLGTNLRKLYLLSKSHGVPQGRKSFLEVDGVLADLLALAGPELQEFFTSNSEDAIRLFRLLLTWICKRPSIEVFEGVSELLELNAVVGLANLNAFLKEWKANSNVSKEEFWQTLFAKNAVVLSQLFAYPVILIKDKAYLGGKGLMNTGGHIVDFLCKLESTGAAALVEIKTPITPLLGSVYRGVYPISNDLAGTISQALKYRSSLMENLQNLQREDPALIASEPYCVVVAGDCAELNSSEKKASFERFRERLNGVRILTFDEVYQRIEGLLKIFTDSSGVSPQVLDSVE